MRQVTNYLDMNEIILFNTVIKDRHSWYMKKEEKDKLFSG